MAAVKEAVALVIVATPVATTSVVLPLLPPVLLLQGLKLRLHLLFR